MNLAMHAEVDGAFECFPALITEVVALLAVDWRMSIQSTLITEDGLADGAFVGFIPGVGLQVSLVVVHGTLYELMAELALLFSHNPRRSFLLVILVPMSFHLTFELTAKVTVTTAVAIFGDFLLLLHFLWNLDFFGVFITFMHS